MPVDVLHIFTYAGLRSMYLSTEYYKTEKNVFAKLTTTIAMHQPTLTNSLVASVHKEKDKKERTYMSKEVLIFQQQKIHRVNKMKLKKYIVNETYVGQAKHGQWVAYSSY